MFGGTTNAVRTRRRPACRAPFSAVVGLAVAVLAAGCAQQGPRPVDAPPVTAPVTAAPDGPGLARDPN